MTFQILPIAGINATQVVSKIEGGKNKFAKLTGYNIDVAYVVDKVGK